MKTAQDVLAEYKANGETGTAARYLQFMVNRDRGSERRYPDAKSKSQGRSGDWQITRSQAARALQECNLDGYKLLEIHLSSAFQRFDGEDEEDQQRRAIETFDACLDAAKCMMKGNEERNFFIMVDAAADHAISILENERRFPIKEEVQKLATESTGIKINTGTEWTKVFACSHLTFLDKKKPIRSKSEWGDY